MVSCLKCGNRLPYDCVCPISQKEKLDLYLKQAIRELKLLLDLMNGHVPKASICLSSEDAMIFSQVDGKVEKIKDFLYKISFTFSFERSGSLVIKLLDKNLEPLYRTKSDWYLSGSQWTVDWIIGIEN
jgi:hypothetical protein